MTSRDWDRIDIVDLLVRGIVGVRPDERAQRQDILVNVALWTDTRPAAESDSLADTVDYLAVCNAIVSHVEAGAPLLLERLAAEIVSLCFEMDSRVRRIEVRVEKPAALPYAKSAAVTLHRERRATERCTVDDVA